ncbi:MAG: hypothetical protein P8Y60_19685 [Calditrichota bacterium]
MYLYKEIHRGLHSTTPIFLSIVVLLFLFGCQSEAPISPVQKSEGESSLNKSTLTLESGFSQTLLKELATARSATAIYHNVDTATTAGYGNINLFVPGMGDHYVNGSLVDGEFEVDKPEALVFNSMGNSGHQKLVAVEYLVATPGPQAGGTPPEGFTGEMDEWEWNAAGFWTLHAWVWLHNRDGMFAELNPALLP